MTQKELEEKLIHYANEYYNGNELISDSEYDALYDELKKNYPNSSLLKNVIGDDLKGVNIKFKLPITMGTLAKVHTVEEFTNWYNSHCSNSSVIAELKVDGNSQLLCYNNGKLYQTLSRGNSELGEDTTSNVSKVNGVKDTINTNGEIYIRGEVVLKDTVFEQYFKNDANPRNTAAGLIKRKNGKDCDKLNFIAYDVFDSNNIIDKTEKSKIDFLKDNGFEVPLWWLGADKNDIIEFRNNIDNYRKQVNYGIDGIVVKQNTVNKEDLMRHTPLNNVAFKPEATTAITTLRDIEWNMEGEILSPVAIFDTVFLDGTEVSRATLHNLNIMEDLGIKIGDKIEVIKSGMIIPKITKVIK